MLVRVRIEEPYPSTVEGVSDEVDQRCIDHASEIVWEIPDSDAAIKARGREQPALLACLFAEPGPGTSIHVIRAHVKQRVTSDSHCRTATTFASDQSRFPKDTTDWSVLRELRRAYRS